MVNVNVLFKEQDVFFFCFFLSLDTLSSIGMSVHKKLASSGVLCSSLLLLLVSENIFGTEWSVGLTTKQYGFHTVTEGLMGE